jgi:hypothetical protein
VLTGRRGEVPDGLLGHFGLHMVNLGKLFMSEFMGLGSYNSHILRAAVVWLQTS